MIHTRHDKRFTLSSRHSFFSSTFVLGALALAMVIGISVLVLAVRYSGDSLPSVSSLYKAWDERDYSRVFADSGSILERHPLDGAVLALNGFAGYYLHLAQTDPAEAGRLLDASIVSMRNAWYRVSDSEKPMIAYILGKAYYQRGYFYADLAEKYLDLAWNSDAQFPDLAEYRGLSASLLGKNAKAIENFTAALSVNPSDILLFTLASTYRKTGDLEKSKQYYLETARSTADETLELKAKCQLALILVEQKDFTAASSEFESILQKDTNFADAHYGLGVIYEAQGDMVRARAEWRKTIRIDPVHPGAREKLRL